MRGILHSLLVIAITLVYGVGSQMVVEIEHSHDLHDHHGHCHADLAPEHDHHHPHDHDSGPVPDDSEDHEQGGEPHHHSHTVALGAEVPMVGLSFPGGVSLGWTSLRSFLPGREPCPDGPCFPLIKPPQLG